MLHAPPKPLRRMSRVHPIKQKHSATFAQALQSVCHMLVWDHHSAKATPFTLGSIGTCGAELLSDTHFS